MLEALRESVCRANRMLPAYGLVCLTWGNVSAADREQGVILIKPSGLSYDEMRPEDIVTVDFETGQAMEGARRPSVDTWIHLEVYRAFPQIRSIVHTHSRWATIWAQAGMAIPALGTTHADEFLGDIPCTRAMRPEEIRTEYERNTGRVISETLRQREVFSRGAVLVRSHGPFAWGETPEKAVEAAVTLEETANMAWHTMLLRGDAASPIPEELLNKHFFRKHGKDSYYGQGGGGGIT